MPSLAYYRRIFSAYLGRGNSHLTFWHETPTENPRASTHELGEYYMLFTEKADYPGPYDSSGVPQLDYRGRIGQQYNPIAIAQYGLGNYSLFRQTADPGRQANFLIAAGLALLPRRAECARHFRLESSFRLGVSRHPESSLVFGSGARARNFYASACKESADSKYRDAVHRALTSFFQPISAGGVAFTDERGDLWFEEYIVSPPTHILNGFIWATWGVHDYFLATKDQAVHHLFSRAVQTLLHNLDRYDLGFWSLYEQSGTRLPMVASPFYHRLHIVQLRIMHRLTGEAAFANTADRWEGYAHSRAKRARALCYKSVFKLCHY